MSKGLSMIVAAVLLIAVTMSVAGILIYWSTSFVQKKLSETGENSTYETLCLGAEFKLHSASFNNGTLFLRIDNRRAIDLTLENLYLFYPDNKMETVPLNALLKGNEIKQFTLSNITDGFTSGKIKTTCPTVFLDFTYSEGTIR